MQVRKSVTQNERLSVFWAACVGMVLLAYLPVAEPVGVSTDRQIAERVFGGTAKCDFNKSTTANDYCAGSTYSTCGTGSGSMCGTVTGVVTTNSQPGNFKQATYSCSSKTCNQMTVKCGSYTGFACGCSSGCL